jgi:hypothetical protein
MPSLPVKKRTKAKSKKKKKKYNVTMTPDYRPFSGSQKAVDPLSNEEV